jgi:hypothetical protein
MAFCTECGTNVAEGIKFCTGCGKPMGKAPAQQEQSHAETPPVRTVTAAVPPVRPAYQAPAQSVFPNGGGKYAVMGTLAYIGHLLLFAVPVVGLIFAVKWAFSSKINQNRRNLARAMLIFAVLGIIAGIFLAIAAAARINSLLEYLRETTGGRLGSWQDLFDQFKHATDQIPSMPTR